MEQISVATEIHPGSIPKSNLLYSRKLLPKTFCSKSDICIKRQLKFVQYGLIDSIEASKQKYYSRMTSSKGLLAIIEKFFEQ